jgi:outer membrane protein TolC
LIQQKGKILDIKPQTSHFSLSSTLSSTSASAPQPSPRLLRMLPVAALVMTIFSGCAIMPEPIGDAERQGRVQGDLQTLFKDVEPLSGDLSLHEAFARALKYNYDYRLRSMEQSMASAQLDVSKYDILPRLTVSAGYVARSNDAGSRSVDLITGVENNLFSGGQESRRSTTNAVLAWNVLDFGVSYVRAQQQAVQVLIADERKRKVVQNISQDVRQAFWRAYGAQKTLPRLEDLLHRVKESLIRSQRLETERLMPPIQALAFQRALIDLHQQIVLRRQELILAKTELAALINLRPGSQITLTSGGEEAQASSLQPLDDLEALDQAALNNRPELREEDYRKKLSMLEARKALLSLLPGLEFNLSSNHDSNKFLFHNNWSEAASTISLNLLRAFSYPAAKRAQESQAVVDNTRRIALGMAVLAQVRIAAQRYQEAQQDYMVSVQAAEVDGRMEKHVRAATKASAESEMELLRIEVKAAVSDLQRYVSLANLQTAYARVANSVGADLLPDAPQIENLKVFTGQLAQADQAWRKTSFHTVDATLAQPQLYVAGITAPEGSGLDLNALLRSHLTRHGVTVLDAPAAQAASVSAEAQVGAPNAGLRAVELVWTVRRGDVVLGSVPYRSVISGSVTTSWSIFGDAAAESAAAKIASLLKVEALRSARNVKEVNE